MTITSAIIIATIITATPATISFIGQHRIPVIIMITRQTTIIMV